MLVSLLGYFFFMITTLTAFLALLVGFFDSNSSLGKGHYSSPAIVHTVSAEDGARWHSATGKEALPVPAIAAVKEPTPHKPKVLARQRNNYEQPGSGNALGYADNGPKRFFTW
jgi:hypothetical protein